MPSAETSTITSQIMIIVIPEPCECAGLGLCASIDGAATGIAVAFAIPDVGNPAAGAEAAIGSIAE